VSAQSHAGYRRTNNEDQFFVTRLGRTLQTLITSLPAGDVPEMTEEVNYVMVVADGMGGHRAGEVASRMAISALISLALDVPDWIFKATKNMRASSNREPACAFGRSARCSSSAASATRRCVAWGRR
jgi:serine/threonine protein phosphatase PrpC